jgi:hypothetical protein
MTDEVRRSLAERWVLEFVIGNSYPIDPFRAQTETEFRAITNGRLAGLRVADLREALVRLAAAGAVEFRRERNMHERPGPLPEQALRAAIQGGQPTYTASPTLVVACGSASPGPTGRAIRIRTCYLAMTTRTMA